MNSKPLIIFHANCADGFGAALAAYKKFGDNADYYPGFYNESPPDCRDREVYMLDFSYKRPEVIDMLAVAKRVIILDHHKSAYDELGDILGKPVRTITGMEVVLEGSISMQMSGAMISWIYFHGNTNIPKLFEYIEDRDLWKFQLEGSKEVALALFSYKYDFGIWEGLLETPVEDLINEGRALLRKQEKDIAEFIPVATRRINIAGYNVPVINVPYFYGSDTCNVLAKGEPFAAYYWDGATHRQWGLRSEPNGVDVAQIARDRFKGGGHKNASGFRTDLNWCGE